MLAWGSGLLVAQNDETADITVDSPAWYLLQAFQGPATRNAAALWHLGMEVDSQDDGYVVAALLDDYPAEQAGLRRGDRLVSLDGRPFHPVTSLNAAQTIGATVQLLVEREGERVMLTVTPVRENLYDSRRSAFLQSIQEFSAGNKRIAYIHPWSLSRNLNDVLGFLDVMADLALSDGLILDLRDSYGYLSIHHVDAFFPSRRDLFRVTGDGSTHTQLELTTPPLRDRPYGKPVAVLINGGTAGGAALLAWQLAKLDRVTTVGEFVEATLQDYAFVDDSGRGYFTSETASGTVDEQPLDVFRVEPKLPIPYPLSQTTRSDPQFQAAFNVLLGLI